MRRRRAAGRVGCERKNSWPGKLFGRIKVRLGMSLHGITLFPFTIRLSGHNPHLSTPTSSLRPRPAAGLHRCAQHRRGKPPQSVATSPTLQIWTRVGSLGVLCSSMMFNDVQWRSCEILGYLNTNKSHDYSESIEWPRVSLVCGQQPCEKSFHKMRLKYHQESFNEVNINTSILMELDSKYDQSGGLEGGSLVDGGMEQWQGAVKAATGLLDRIWSLWWKQQCVNVYVVTSEVRWQRRYSLQSTIKPWSFTNPFNKSVNAVNTTTITTSGQELIQFSNS